MKHSSIPRVFISYSHEPGDHDQQVRELADSLRNDGIDAYLDSYEERNLDNWESWSKQQIAAADFVLVVCTPTYQRLFQAKGRPEESLREAKTWEGSIIDGEAYIVGGGNDKFIPVVLLPQHRPYVPAPLSEAACFNLWSTKSYKDLCSFLLNAVQEGRPGGKWPSQPAMHVRRRFLASPQASDAEYPSNHARSLSEALREAYERKAELDAMGADTSEALRYILHLRRRQRENTLQVGDLFLDGRLKLLKLIGSGGFAEVWKAYDSKSKQTVAVKFLHGQFADDRTRRERFFRGARKMADLRHPGIVRVFSRKEEENGHYFFIMEYLGGGDLRQAVLEKRLPPERILAILLQVGEALGFGHENGIVHRDIKPGNILLSSHSRPKLSDFDLVKATDTTGGTRSGMKGTVFYAAPEAMNQAQNAGIPADVFSLGMTAVFAFAGKDLDFEVFRDSRSYIRRIGQAPDVLDVLERAVLWNPQARYPSVRDFCDALRQTELGAASMKIFMSDQAGPSDEPEIRISSGDRAQRLSEEEAEGYRKLVVFPAETPIPLSTLARYWGYELAAADTLCQRLAEWWLLPSLQDGDILFLETAVPRYLPAGQRATRQLHAQLLDAHRPDSQRWHEMPAGEPYLWHHLAYHLVRSGQHAELLNLLADYWYIEAKIAAVGINALLLDFKSAFLDDELRVVQKILSKISSHISAFSGQLGGQLAGQLASHLIEELQEVQHPKLLTMLEAARSRTTWIQPIAPVVRSEPGDSDTAILVGIRTLGQVVSSTDGRHLVTWDVETGQPLEKHAFPHPGVRSFQVLDKENHLLVYRDRVCIWNVAKDEVSYDYPSQQGASLAAAGLRGRDLIIIDGRTVQMRRLDSKELLRFYDGWVDDSLPSLLPLGERRFVIISGAAIFICDARTGRTVKRLHGHQKRVNAIVTDKYRRLMSASDDGTIRVWDTGTGQCLRTMSGHTEKVEDLADLGRGCLASVSADRTLRIWYIETGATLYRFDFETELSAVAFCDVSRCLLVVDASGKCHFLRLKMPERANAVSIHSLVDILDQKILALGMSGFRAGYAAWHELEALECFVRALEGLPRDLLKRFMDLAILREEEEVHPADLSKMWNVPLSDVYQSLARLRRDGLLRYDHTVANLGLGGVVPRFLQPMSDSLTAPHRQFVDCLRPKSGDWCAIPDSDRYLWRYLGFHLACAGLFTELRNVLRKEEYLQKKLDLLGVEAVLEDFEYIPFTEDTHRAVPLLKDSAAILDTRGVRLTTLLARGNISHSNGALSFISGKDASKGLERLEEVAEKSTSYRAFMLASHLPALYAIEPAQGRTLAMKLVKDASDDIRLQALRALLGSGSLNAHSLDELLVAAFKRPDPLFLQRFVGIIGINDEDELLVQRLAVHLTKSRRYEPLLLLLKRLKAGKVRYSWTVQMAILSAGVFEAPPTKSSVRDDFNLPPYDHVAIEHSVAYEGHYYIEVLRVLFRSLCPVVFPDSERYQGTFEELPMLLESDPSRHNWHQRPNLAILLERTVYKLLSFSPSAAVKLLRSCLAIHAFEGRSSRCLSHIHSYLSAWDLHLGYFQGTSKAVAGSESWAQNWAHFLREAAAVMVKPDTEMRGLVAHDMAVERLKMEYVGQPTLTIEIVARLFDNKEHRARLAAATSNYCQSFYVAVGRCLEQSLCRVKNFEPPWVDFLVLPFVRLLALIAAGESGHSPAASRLLFIIVFSFGRLSVGEPPRQLPVDIDGQCPRIAPLIERLADADESPSFLRVCRSVYFLALGLNERIPGYGNSNA